jgi:hypothetical protein
MDRLQQFVDVSRLVIDRHDHDTYPASRSLLLLLALPARL